MTNPIIGYDNALNGDAAVVTVSSENGDNVKENCLDWRLDDYWQPLAGTTHSVDLDYGSNAAVDYVAIFSNLKDYSGVDIEVYYGSSYPPTTKILDVAGPSDQSAAMHTFNTIIARYWRIDIVMLSAETPKFQMISLGNNLVIERCLTPGFASPILGANLKATTNISEKGVFIGRSLKSEPVKFNLRFELLSEAWVRSNWPPMLAHIQELPFFIQTQPDWDDAVFCWTDRVIATPIYSHPSHLTVSLKLKAFL